MPDPQAHVYTVKIGGVGLLTRFDGSRLLVGALQDIEDFAARAARHFAPSGPTKRLREEGIDEDRVVREPPGGRYRGSIRLSPLVPEAVWVHDGTGIYGPLKRPIVPREASRLTFYWNARGRWVSTKMVRGQKPQPFITEAFLLADRTFIPYRVERLRERLEAELNAR